MQLFCYGTLQFPVVLRQVTGCRRTGQPAWLDGYACHVVQGQVYPALCAQPGAVTAGVVYRDIDARQLARLDAWEGQGYERIRVQVRAASGHRRPAWAYVVSPRHRERLTSGTWDREEFRRRYLQRFLRDRRG